MGVRQNTIVDLSIKPSLEDIKKRLGSMSDKAPDVLCSVLKRVMSRVRQVVPKEISKKYKITTKNFRKWVKYSRVSKKNLHTWYSAKSYPLSIAKYYKSKPSQPKSTKGKTIKQIAKMRYVKTLVERGHGFKTHKHAFIQKMKNKHYGVFRRTLKGSSKISEIKGASAGSVLGNEKIQEKVQIEVDKIVNTRLEHEISRLLGR